MELANNSENKDGGYQTAASILGESSGSFYYTYIMLELVYLNALLFNCRYPISFSTWRFQLLMHTESQSPEQLQQCGCGGAASVLFNFIWDIYESKATSTAWLLTDAQPSTSHSQSQIGAADQQDIISSGQPKAAGMQLF